MKTKMDIKEIVKNEERQILRELGIDIGDTIEVQTVSFSGKGGARKPKKKIFKVEGCLPDNSLVKMRDIQINCVTCYSFHDLKNEYKWQQI